MGLHLGIYSSPRFSLDLTQLKSVQLFSINSCIVYYFQLFVVFVYLFIVCVCVVSFISNTIISHTRIILRISRIIHDPMKVRLLATVRPNLKIQLLPITAYECSRLLQELIRYPYDLESGSLRISLLECLPEYATNHDI